MKYENCSIRKGIFFTKENFINGIGLELSSNQNIEHEVYDSIDITGEFRVINSKTKSMVTVFSLFESNETPMAQALIDINIDKNNKLKADIIIKNKFFNKKFEYLEKCYNFFINTNKKYVTSNLKMVVDLIFNKEKIEINDINVFFLIEAELDNKKYILNVEEKCKEVLIQYNLYNFNETSSMEYLTKIINILQYNS